MTTTKPIIVHHHLGLGDHICCNALVRHLVEKHGPLSLVCKPKNLDNVRFMYRDEPRITVVPLPKGGLGERYAVDALVKERNATLIRVGFKDPYHHSDPVSPDEYFYQEQGVDYEQRFDGFWFDRDLEAEQDAFDRLVGDAENYIFVQSDKDRGFPLMDVWDDDALVVNNDPSIPLFHLGLILERASELHLPNSSIRCLIEGRQVFDLSGPRLVFHDLRAPIWGDSTRLKWAETIAYGNG
jgi:hypothetical protein